ncbi:MAG: hypothetical protein R2799_02920 [Crocinitomicaceae bacterium]
MKLLIYIILLTPLITYSQFKVSTVETSSGITKEAECHSSSKSTFASPTTIKLGVTSTKILFLKLLVKPFSAVKTARDSDFEEIKLGLVFYDSKGEKQHTYYTYSGGYSKVNNGYWIFINDDKVITYFKKYSKVIIGYDGGAFGTVAYEFSLSGFTSACNKLLQ